MQFGVCGGRSKIISNEVAIDIESASDGRFGPKSIDIYQDWAAFREWARDAPLGPIEPFDVLRADAPSDAPQQIFAVGLNYREHQVESNMPAPEQPMIFTKFQSALGGASGDLVLPTDSVDWEVELAIVVGKRSRHVAREDAWSYIAGITAAQDYSARDVQMRPAEAPQFSLGKSFPGFARLGPVLITPDDLTDPDSIELSCSINGETVQSSNTNDLIFTVGEIIEYLSGLVTLLPGDIVFTGTPAGVGLGMRPPRFLAVGDQIVTQVAGMTMHHHAVAPTPSSVQ